MEHSVQRLAQQSVCSAAMAKLTMITVIACMSSSGLAQDSDAGKYEYQSSCEACHGQDGKGNGTDSVAHRLPLSNSGEIVGLTRRKE